MSTWSATGSPGHGFPEGPRNTDGSAHGDWLAGAESLLPPRGNPPLQLFLDTPEKHGGYMMCVRLWRGFGGTGFG